MSEIRFWKICAHRNVLYAQHYFDKTLSLFNYNETREYETKSDAPQHIIRIDVNFKNGFCVIRDLIVMIRQDQPQLYFFSLEGDFVKSQTIPFLKDKEILDSYNDDSMLAWDSKKKKLWVVKQNGEATKINIDAQDPSHACVVGKNLFVHCYKKEAIIKYVSS